MMTVSLALALTGAALSQLSSQHITPGKMALDMNVECVSLLGKNLYAKPLEGTDIKALQARLAEADKHVAAQPENPAVRLEQGNALKALWHYHDAVQAYSRAIALNPADANAYSLRADAFVVLRQFSQARADYQHASALEPQNAEPWVGIGIASYLLRDFRGAHDAFTKALELGPSAYPAWLIGTWDAWAAPRVSPAQTPLPGGTPGEPDVERSRYAEGVTQLLAGNRDEAIATWRALADSGNWVSIWVIAAEAELAAIEGAKKMKPLV